MFFKAHSSYKLGESSNNLYDISRDQEARKQEISQFQNNTEKEKAFHRKIEELRKRIALIETNSFKDSNISELLKYLPKSLCDLLEKLFIAYEKLSTCSLNPQIYLKPYKIFPYKEIEKSVISLCCLIIDCFLLCRDSFEQFYQNKNKNDIICIILNLIRKIYYINEIDIFDFNKMKTFIEYFGETTDKYNLDEIFKTRPGLNKLVTSNTNTFNIDSNNRLNESTNNQHLSKTANEINIERTSSRF